MSDDLYPFEIEEEEEEMSEAESWDDLYSDFMSKNTILAEGETT